MSGTILYASGKSPSILYEHMDRIMVTDWPTELWQAEPAGAEMAVVKGEGIFQCERIRLVERLSPAGFFGPHGTDVVTILDRIAMLKPDHIECLAGSMGHGQADSYCKAWRLWLHDLPAAQSLSDAVLSRLLFSHHGRGVSPVAYGLYLIASVFRRWAEELYATEAFGEADATVLQPDWHNAQQALVCAAMGLGMKEQLSKGEFDTLTLGWRLINH